ncbi:MAG TPA: ribbon-helix-helix protein, CopG family [Thermodesulfobacteriota bacterium]|nr:ribbon-helix-helix protein, CopG family [Thermodesulfobacteriota bacterium]
MKTAISLPEKVFRATDRLARRRRSSRSAIIAEALTEYLERHGAEGVTESLNRVYAGEDSRPDPFLVKIQALSIPREDW